MLSTWKNIWNNKYREDNRDIYNIPAHVEAGLDKLSLNEWKIMVDIFSRIIGINKKSNILDIGCGAGAFIE